MSRRLQRFGYGQCIAAGAIALLTLSSVAHANVITVCQGGTCDHDTIQGAIDAANEGDTIVVSAGTYEEWIDFGTKNLVVESVDGYEKTLLGVYGSPESIVTIAGGQTSATELRGFTIRRGYAGTPVPGNPSSLVGGGLYIEESNPLIDSCYFTDNKTAYGAGCYVFQGDPTFTSCIFFDNYATTSGGGLQIFISSVEVENCTFEENTAVYDGGGTKIVLGNCSFENCTFFNNNATEGGAMYWFSSQNPAPHSLQVVDCDITENFVSSSGFGGGIRSRYGYPLMEVSGTTVCDNSPDQIYGPIDDVAGNTLCICPADFNRDGTVNGNDLGILLAFWGVCPEPCFEDLNHDGVVDGGDLGLFLAFWGPCPTP